MTVKVSFKKTIVKNVIVEVPERYFRTSRDLHYDELDRYADLFLINQHYSAAGVIDIDITRTITDNIRSTLADNLHSEDETLIYGAMERFGAAYRLAELCIEEAKTTYKWIDDYDD